MIWFTAFVVGVGVGLFSFGGLWLTVRQMIQMRYRRTGLIMSQIGRLGLCVVVFGALSREGIGAILPALGGFWIAHLHLIRRLGVAADGK